MRISFFVAGALALAWGVPASAVPLPVGVTALPGTTAALRPELAGVVLADRLVAYSNGGGTDGFVQQRVVRETDSGTLDFYWRILPSDGGDAPVTAFRTIGFTDFVSDGDWRIDGVGDVAPTAARNFGGGAVNFLFSDPAVGPASDASSNFFFLRTSAVRFNDSGLYDFVFTNDTISGEYGTFAPTDSVPEPDSWALMLMGFGAIGALVRNRRLHSAVAG